MTELPVETPVPAGLIGICGWARNVPALSPGLHPCRVPRLVRLRHRGTGRHGAYSFYQIFTMLKLGSPLSVEAGRSQFWKIEDFTWHKQITACRIRRPR